MNNKKDFNQENAEETIKNQESQILDNIAEKADSISKDIPKEKYKNEALDKELEELAKTFKTELDKAKSEADVLKDIFDDEGIIEEDDLCACCGERRKDKSFGENYEYCAECREAMKRYPFNVQSVLIAVVVICISIFSIINFSDFFSGYYLAYKAEKNAKANKITSAISDYNEALNYFDQRGILPGKLFVKSAYNVFDTMLMGTQSMDDVVGRIEKGLTEAQTKMPIHKSEVELRREAIILKGTMQKFYEVVENEKYKDFKPDNQKMYEQIMTDIGSIIDMQVSVPSIDGGKIEQAGADMAMVRFCQYMFAYSCEKYDDSYQYMLEVEKLKPEYTWLYGFELAFTEVQKGNIKKAEEICQRILNNNIESPDGYIVKSFIERMTGETDEAIKSAELGIKYNPENPELIRSKAMALCVKGDFKQAKKLIDTIYENNKYGMLCFTKIVVENELNNKNEVKALKEELKSQGIKTPERLQDYLDGRLTAKQLFSEGTGDAQ